MLQLSERDASILLGATLMHWGVPFRFAVKRPLTDQQQATIDHALDKLRAIDTGSLDSDLSATEIALLVDVLNNCLEECGNDPVELRLQMHAAGNEVTALLGRMRASQAPVLESNNL